MKLLLIVCLFLSANTVNAAKCNIEQGETKETSCSLEQAMVDSALKKYKPQGPNDIRLFCGYNPTKIEACRALLRYVDKDSGQMTEDVFEEWFVNPASGIRWRGFFVKGENGYNLYWSTTSGKIQDKPYSVTFSDKAQREIKVSFDGFYPSFEISYNNVDPDIDAVRAQFVYTDEELVIEKFNLVKKDGETVKEPVADENDRILRYQSVRK